MKHFISAKSTSRCKHKHKTHNAPFFPHLSSNCLWNNTVFFSCFTWCILEFNIVKLNCAVVLHARFLFILLLRLETQWVNKQLFKWLCSVLRRLMLHTALRLMSLKLAWSWGTWGNWRLLLNFVTPKLFEKYFLNVFI